MPSSTPVHVSKADLAAAASTLGQVLISAGPDEPPAYGDELPTSKTFDAPVYAPTAAPGTTTTQLATTEFVGAGLAVLSSDLTELGNDVAALEADLHALDAAVVHISGAESIAGVKTFADAPVGPTASPGTNTTQLATTAFVAAAVGPLATDAAVVHKNGDETIAGVKTFTGNITSNRGTTSQNVEAFGSGALSAVTTGGNNVAVGASALTSLTTSNNSTAVGHAALNSYTGAGSCTAVGYFADGAKTAGGSCTALGASTSTAGFNQSTAVGYQATCTASNQVMLGTATETVVAPGLTRLTNLQVYKTATGGQATLDVVNTESTSTTLGQSSRVRLGPFAGFTGNPSYAPYIEGVIDTAGSAGVAIGTYQGDGAPAKERIRFTSTGKVGFGTQAPVSQFGFVGSVGWQAPSSTTADQIQAFLMPSWADSTDATRKGRLSCYVVDAAGSREAWRVDTDGTQSTLTIYGSSTLCYGTMGATNTLAVQGVTATWPGNATDMAKISLGAFVNSAGGNPDQVAFTTRLAASGANFSAQWLVWIRDAAGVLRQRLSVGPSGEWDYLAPTDTTGGRVQGKILPEWVDGADATRKGRMSLIASDFNGFNRVGLVVESDGTQPLLRFFASVGTGSAVAKPTVTGSRGGNVALASLLTALAALNLITDSTTA